MAAMGGGDYHLGEKRASLCWNFVRRLSVFGCSPFPPEQKNREKGRARKKMEGTNGPDPLLASSAMSLLLNQRMMGNCLPFGLPGLALLISSRVTGSLSSSYNSSQRFETSSPTELSLGGVPWIFLFSVCSGNTASFRASLCL